MFKRLSLSWSNRVASKMVREPFVTPNICSFPIHNSFYKTLLQGLPSS